MRDDNFGCRKDFPFSWFIFFSLSLSLPWLSFSSLFDHLMGIACSAAVVISICRIFRDNFITSFNYLISACWIRFRWGFFCCCGCCCLCCCFHSERKKKKSSATLWAMAWINSVSRPRTQYSFSFNCKYYFVVYFTWCFVLFFWFLCVVSISFAINRCRINAVKKQLRHELHFRKSGPLLLLKSIAIIFRSLATLCGTYECRWDEICTDGMIKHFYLIALWCMLFIFVRDILVTPLPPYDPLLQCSTSMAFDKLRSCMGLFICSFRGNLP